MSDTIKDFADTISVPIYSLDVFGHGIYNYPMVYNGDVTISSRKKVMILKNFAGE
jgi:muramoyltetrapeptide carboxypeptidase LdcA involved in peptidoglycan recycling